MPHPLVLFIVLLLPCLCMTIPCPFDHQNGDNCTCIGPDKSGTIFRNAGCFVGSADWIPLDAAPISSYSISDQLYLEFDYYSPLNRESFISLKYIHHLAFESTDQRPIALIIDPDTFIGTEIRHFSAGNFSYMLPPAAAIRSLAKTGLESLRYYNGHPTDLKAYEFLDFSNLKSLELDNMVIRSINESAFTGLQQTLTRLSLTRTRLSEYPYNALIDLVKLQVLDLSDNVMSEIPPEAFSGFEYLKELRLAGNVIQSAVQSAAFNEFPRGVITLDLSRGFLQSIPTSIFPQITRVLNLDLANNLITTVRKGDFSNGTNLSVLDLGQNPIEYLENGAFQGLTKLHKLKIQDTNLEAIDLGVFNGLDQLEVLEMGYNYHLRNVTIDPAFHLPLSIKHIILVSSSINVLDPNFDSILSRENFQVLDISMCTQLICDSRLHWMAKHAFCSPQRLLIDNARCINLGTVHLATYLAEMVADPCK